MDQINYHDLRVLVADDFSNFRSTVTGMLMDMGVDDVDMASNGEEVIEKCSLKAYDLILCDYDLGPGRNGQHVLEELRYRKAIGVLSIFVIVSAEASRNIVMAAYDCEPDDYLMKPITGLMLQKRIRRLLLQKEALRPVYRALAREDYSQATDLLVDMSIAEGRSSTAAQKMLGELFIQQGELQKAEKLYSRAMEARPLDWARLGMARTKHLQGEFEKAGAWLEKIVEGNPLYLQAYDVLADNWEHLGNFEQAQGAVARAVDVSPLSILRQKRLACIASQNEDPSTAIEALRRTIKLGRQSCYGSVNDSFELARTIASAIEKNLALPQGASEEALVELSAAKEAFDLDDVESAQMELLKGRIYANAGDVYEARKCMLSAQQAISEGRLDIDAEVDQVALLFALGETEHAEDLLENLQGKYKHDQSALEKLDKFLTEPASESSRELVAKINREGIDLYSVGEFDGAIACFNKARVLFPKHIGIQLNIVQALVGKMKECDDQSKGEALQEQCHSCLILVESLVDRNHPQFERFTRLKRRADIFLKKVK